MSTVTLTSTAPVCDRCRQQIPAEPGTDLGFGHSRESDDWTAPTPVPDGVDLIALTGRALRRAA